MPFTLFATPRHRAPYELRAQCGLLREWCCSNTPSPTQEATDGYCLCHARSRQSEPEETAAAAGDYRCGPGGGSPLAATQARPGADRDPARVATALVQRIAGPGAGAGRIPGEHRALTRARQRLPLELLERLSAWLVAQAIATVVAHDVSPPPATRVVLVDAANY